ncbi:hypothetical protein QMK33_18975 [Hymenobacter sp. H14-R3]|uniref:hypothetical protein n=1 Tax=Hymenobacter sp. H14-R3 TaxID=3046308 RepID=UPI0024B93D23|nr:hypothetical protein [Hymenobacter sp. H14-R3]MDJ0367237.1 hypothetical protein [Hymenobacter sp. H14-R3]
MARRLTIYSIYKLGLAERHYLLQTEQPEYANVSQSQEDTAVAAEQASRQRLLAQLLQALPLLERGLCEFVGQLQDLPVGEVLYTAPSYAELPVYYGYTRYGYPWVVLGTAASENAFLAEVEATEELVGLQPIGPLTKIMVTLVRALDVAL